MDKLDGVRRSWDRFAETDPMGAVLTGSGWDEASFYETGLKDVDALVSEISALDLGVHFGAALDFGCGMGRLSFGLSRHFDRVMGVDISSKMLDLAATNERAPENVEFHLNEGKRLEGIQTDSYDFVLSLIVLQHVPQKMIKGYLREFLRVLKPGGIAIFQLPTHRFKLQAPVEVPWEGRALDWDSPSSWALCYRVFFRSLRWTRRKVWNKVVSWYRLYKKHRARQRLRRRPFMEMNYLSARSLKKHIKRNGGSILHVEEDSRADDEFESHLFFVQKHN